MAAANLSNSGGSQRRTFLERGSLTANPSRSMASCYQSMRLARSLYWPASRDTPLMNSPNWNQWELEFPGCGWAIRFESYEVVVLDLEKPGKGSIEGGLFHLHELEKIYGPLPGCPKARSLDMGEHWYRLCLPEYIGRLHNWNGTFPSIDLRTSTGNVLLPPSFGRTWITTFEEAPMQYLPSWICELIVKRWAHSSSKKVSAGSGGQRCETITTKEARNRFESCVGSA
jgi:hypothetical protein